MASEVLESLLQWLAVRTRKNTHKILSCFFIETQVLVSEFVHK